MLGPRQRRKVCYALDKMDKELEKHLNSSDDDSGNGKVKPDTKRDPITDANLPGILQASGHACTPG